MESDPGLASPGGIEPARCKVELNQTQLSRTLGVEGTPFFPGILLSRNHQKPGETQLVIEKIDAKNPGKHNWLLKRSMLENKGESTHRTSTKLLPTQKKARATWGLFKIQFPGNGPFAGLSRSFRGPMFSFLGDKPVLKNLFPSPNEGSTMYLLCFKSFRVPFAGLSRCSVFLSR